MNESKKIKTIMESAELTRSLNEDNSDEVNKVILNIKNVFATAYTSSIKSSLEGVFPKNTFDTLIKSDKKEVLEKLNQVEKDLRTQEDKIMKFRGTISSLLDLLTYAK